MAKLKQEILDNLLKVIDKIEETFGEIEGFEVLLTKNKDGETVFSELKELNLYYFTKINILKAK